MMKVTLVALLVLAPGTSAFVVAPTTAGRPALSLAALPGAAASAEEDLMLTLKVIMDHVERSTTASKDQFISQMEDAQSVDDSDQVDVSVPYDAAAQLAYEAAGSPGDYEAFKEQYEADAVADVIAKNNPVDLSIPYDAAAKLAYKAAKSPGDYAAFKKQFEADAVADVIAKNAPPVDLSIHYDAAAKLAFEKAGSPGDFAESKAKFEADAVADVVAKNAKPEPVAA